MFNVLRPGVVMALLAIAALAGAAVPSEPAAFAAARARGELVVGVAYLAPPAVAGAKIRTPERLDTAIAEKLGERLGLPVALRELSSEQALSALAAGQVDLMLTDGGALGTTSVAPMALSRVPTGYITRPKAVIRSDTTLTRGADLTGRRVCMASANTQAQTRAIAWGAQVQTFPVPSDALVAVREGNCDVALIDDAVWAPLMQFPEWKKFSSTLAPEGPRSERVWQLAATDGTSRVWLEGEMRAWQRDRAWKTLTTKWARDVAFDVYMDQEVPDCHG